MPAARKIGYGRTDGNDQAPPNFRFSDVRVGGRAETCDEP